MLYRRHLRIKVLQALYTWYTTGSDDLTNGEKLLLQSVNKLYELFIYQLSFLVEVKRFAEVRMEENKSKFYPTEDDLDPNTKFVNNKVIKLLEENLDFQRKESAYKINWADETDIVRKFYGNLKNKDLYAQYMSDKRSTFELDKKLFVKIVDQLLPGFDLLKSFYEEKSVYFTDGYDLVILLLIKYFDTVEPDFTENTALPGIFKPSVRENDEDQDFLKELYRKTILQDAETTEIIKAKTINWEYDRIPLMDIILLKMAIVELKEMETVPVKVTLNEYIELARYFSSAKSKTFVNGVLDKLIREFKEAGKIKKVGRGLIG